MRTSTRYALVGVLSLLCLVLLLRRPRNARSDELTAAERIDSTNARKLLELSQFNANGSCTFATCFNWTRCAHSRKIYVYPVLVNSKLSVVYANILKILQTSKFTTTNPDEACMLILSVDTIDRDRTSANYVTDLQTYIDLLPSETWRNGENHIIFNLYHGTWPHYSELDLGFDTGKAILARASASETNFRKGFDLSFPLFHSEHPLTSNVPSTNISSARRDLLVSFKGKRYVYGIGSETRDSLFHLHDGETIVMLTTCKHNNDWANYKDDRCDADNDNYGAFDYQDLLARSIFCLTPRGRRLGSFRFLEALKAGCIPVVLSDDWVLPFTELIDWNTAAIRILEKDTVLVPDILYSISKARIRQMRIAAKYLYEAYFSSVERITLTAIEIIFKRLEKFSIATSSVSFPPKTFYMSGSAIAVIQAHGKLSAKLLKLLSLLEDSLLFRKIFILTPSVASMKSLNETFSKELHFVISDEMFCLSCLPRQYFDLGDSIAVFDARSSVENVELSLLIDALHKNSQNIVCLHTFTFKIFSANGFQTQLKMAFPSAALFQSIYLKDFWIDGYLAECDWVRLSIAITTTSKVNPYRIGFSSKEPWMNTTVFGRCAFQLMQHFPTGLRVSPAEEHYVY